ncbi:MAG: ABC transporter substrate-binding protein, partial [Herpetosiphonaceae bacterium]|nr:ABC transporter substrate-binding protein [Herpetosiphonaceae bacterium]
MKRFLSFLLVSTMLLGILAACGGTTATTVPAATTAPATDATAAPVADATAAPATGASTEVTGEVTLWHAYGTGSAEEATIAKLIANAQAANPNATINVLQ